MSVKSNTKRRRIWPIVVAVLAAILLAVVISIYLYWNGKLNLIHFDDGSREIDTSTSYEVNNEELDIGTLPDAPSGVEGSIHTDNAEIYQDEHIQNILLLGTDDRTREFSDNARADSIMVLSLNTELHTIKLVSIERGIGVPVPGRNDDWITHTFRYGGAKLTLDTVRECFDLDIDRYVRVNFHVFEDAINAIGGIDMSLTQAEADYLNKLSFLSGYRDFHAGMNHLDGLSALSYSRIRKIDSDWGRIVRQRKVIQAALNQVKNLGLTQLDALANTILPMVQTNLTKSEINSLLFEIPGFLSNGVVIDDMTIPTFETCWNSVGVDGRKMIGVDFAANAQILHDFFYSEKTSEEILSPAPESSSAAE